MPTERFTNQGSQTTWTVPDAVEEVTIKTWGARGARGDAETSGSDNLKEDSSQGGPSDGGNAEATVPVTPGDTLDIFVGEQADFDVGGWPDGDDGDDMSASADSFDVHGDIRSGGGGGSSRVELNGTALVQAGGGGGGGAAAVGYFEEYDSDPNGYDGCTDTGAGSGGSANTGDGADASAEAEGTDYYQTGYDTKTANSSGGQNGGETSYAGEETVGNSGVGLASGGGGGGGRATGEKPQAEVDRGDDLNLSGWVAAAGGGGSGTAHFDSSATNTSTTDSTFAPTNGSDGEVVIEYEEPPDPPSELAVTGGSSEADLSWTNDPDEYDEVEVYRATQSGSEDTADYALVETISGTAETYTDTGLDDGERYYYRVRGVIGGVSVGLSNEDDGTTDLPAPTNLSHPSTGDESGEYAWTANHNRGDTRVEYRESDASEWQTYATVAFDVESETVDGLLNGEEYDSRVVAETEHAETEDE